MKKMKKIKMKENNKKKYNGMKSENKTTTQHNNNNNNNNTNIQEHNCSTYSEMLQPSPSTLLQPTSVSVWPRFLHLFHGDDWRHSGRTGEGVFLAHPPPSRQSQDAN